MMTPFRVGFGYDVHQWDGHRDLWLGGIKIDHSHGLLGHSDADVLIHAICDALLGAADLRDIGYHFPDTDPRFKGADSKLLLREVGKLLATSGWKIGNIDATMVAEQPKLNPHIPQMKEVIAEILHIEQGQVSLKATTSEQLGFVGRAEGMAVHAVALIFKD